MASAETPPRRRFLPQPVETSARSSRQQHVNISAGPTTAPAEGSGGNSDKMNTVRKPRRFLPQPIEETSRTSRRTPVEKDKTTDTEINSPAGNDKKSPWYSDDPANPGYRTSRPAASSDPVDAEPVASTTPATRAPRRKFAATPLETSSRSSKDSPRRNKESESSSSPSRPRRRFAPEPVETTTIRRRRREPDDDSNESAPDSPSELSSRTSSRQSTGSRRFSPELIETAKGSYRHKRTPDSPQSAQLDLHASEPTTPTTPRSPESYHHAEPPESRFSAAALAKRSHEENRRHSYCIPNLPIIESESSSDESRPPSLTDSAGSTDNEQHKLPQINESTRESFTDYVLSLSSSQDRKRLQEQAMAAYINEVPYEPVSHFAVDEEEDDMVQVGTLSGENGADPRTFRRLSEGDHDLEMQTMRKHHEQLEQAKRELQEDTAGISRFSATALAHRHHHGQVHKETQKTQKHRDEDADYARMKKAANPPMLGSDLIFPYTVSPKLTRCDVDQAPRPRRADSDDEHVSLDNLLPHQLWNAQAGIQNNAGAGLWMGSCQRPAEPSRPATPTRSGLQTPANEVSNPFEPHSPGRGSLTPGAWCSSRSKPTPYHGTHLLPVTPPRSTESSADEFTTSIDKKLQLEKQIEEEFQPRVISQIYNYLSLGFPSLARDFDVELSKISRIPVKELRKDDLVQKGTIRGYVGTPEAEGVWEEDEDGTVKGCKRWEALRLYVKEWARQSPNFTTAQSAPVVQDPTLAHIKTLRAEVWGATVRKGSWAH